MATIEDLEIESKGRYVRLSIDDELTDDEYNTIYEFLNSIVRDKKVPKLSGEFHPQEE